jgi:enoyl-CoA hydratase/carnithine racemase
MSQKKRDIDLAGPLDGVRYERRGDGIAIITLDRPERGNALTPAMQPIIRAIWEEVRDDPGLRVAIVTAAGERHFCTGFDVAEAESEHADRVFDNRPLHEAVHWSPHQNRVWKPVICAVGGLCVGGGLHFAVDADIVIASENAAFMDTHVNVGMVGALENVGLARRLPLGAALRMTLMGRNYRMSARRAYELGLVDELVATSAEVLPTALEMAAAMLDNSPQAMALSKQAVWGSLEQGYGAALEQAAGLVAAAPALEPPGLRRGAARLRGEARAALEPGSQRARRERWVNFAFSAQEEAFRAEVVEFLRDHRDVDAFFLQGQQWERVKALFRAMGARGWLSLGWPAQPGGAGARLVYEYILWDEVAYARAARNPLASGIVAKTIARYGSEAQKERWLPPIRSGEAHFSECPLSGRA